jgi:RNA polymerase sigma-70 factor (ECF subfamily)
VDRSDAQLLDASARGNAEAYAIFFRRHVQAVTTYALRRCSQPEDVADLVADTFLIALRAAGRYVPETATALPWLFGIARKVLAKQRRGVAGTRRLMVKATNSHHLISASEEDAIADAIDASRQGPALEAALATLSPGERDVLELVAYDGLSPAEAAVVLNVTPNAARLRLSRARRQVRTLLDSRPEREARHAF